MTQNEEISLAEHICYLCWVLFVDHFRCLDLLFVVHARFYPLTDTDSANWLLVSAEDLLEARELISNRSQMADVALHKYAKV